MEVLRTTLEEGKKVTLEEARNLIHKLDADRHGPLLFLPVPETSRIIGVPVWGDDKMVIHTSHPADIISSQVLTTWGNKELHFQELFTDIPGLQQVLPAHVPTMEEWREGLIHLSHHAPPLTDWGVLNIYHNEHLGRRYDELLAALPSAIPHLFQKKGLWMFRMAKSRVSGRQVLAFLDSLHDEDYKIAPAEDFFGNTCTGLLKEGHELRIQLYETTVTGEATVLEEVRVRSEKTGLLHKPSWRE